MAIKNIIAKGIGFTPGSVKFIPTHGFSIAAVAVVTSFCVEAQTVAVPGDDRSVVFLPGDDRSVVTCPEQ